MSVQALDPQTPTFVSERGPGCGDDCVSIVAYLPGLSGRRVTLLHAPAAHEAYGASQAGVPQVVETGPLTVDLTANRVYLSGQELTLSPRALAVLLCLAERPGAIIPTSVLARLVLGPGYEDAEHLLRVTISRLRTALGVAGVLIVNHRGNGYRLDTVPVDVVLATRRWARDFDACIDCGRTTQYMHARGRCSGCHFRSLREATP